MSIVITNTGTVKTKDGIHEYILKINNDRICAFTHHRERGLAACLREAADTVDETNRLVRARLMEKLAADCAEAGNGC
jgi:hypothetical protein